VLDTHLGDLSPSVRREMLESGVVVVNVCLQAAVVGGWK
jgi:hypothetical protein